MNVVKKKKIYILFLIGMTLFSQNVFAKRGCCSHHGGVAGCSSTGRQICADGTLSPTCGCTPVNIYGCTDRKAKNYNSSANVEDGSCIYDVQGCMDQNAINYLKKATIPDGSCEYERRDTEIIIIPFETDYRTSLGSSNEEEIVIQKGNDGKKEIIYKSILNEKGEIIKKEQISEKILNKPTKEIIGINKITKNNINNSSMVSVLWLICSILNFIYLNKKQYCVKCLFTYLKNGCYKNKKLLYFLYYILVLPVFIDTVCIFQYLLKKCKK